MINALSFDVEDWFQVENLRAACPVEKWGTFSLRVERNTDILLDLLSQYGHKATFFILGWVAERRPSLVKKIASLGHEIASHGYNHEIVYKMTPASFKEDLIRSKRILEDITGNEVIGYRAPNFSIVNGSLWAVDILKELGFSYDSSIFPVSFHDRYGFNGKAGGSFFKFKNGTQEFTLTVYRFAGLNLPVAGGGYFRIIPYAIIRFLLKKINREGKSFVFYLHPWELDNGQPRVKISLNFYLRHYANLNKTVFKLKRLLKDFRFQPLRSFLQ